MGLINDEGVVVIQKPVMLNFSQQDAIGHQLDKSVAARLVPESNLVTDRLTDRLAQFLGNSGRNSPGSDPSRLRMPNHALHAPAGFKTYFWKLCCLS